MTFGGRTLFENASFQVNNDERVASLAGLNLIASTKDAVCGFFTVWKGAVC